MDAGLNQQYVARLYRHVLYAGWQDFDMHVGAPFREPGDESIGEIIEGLVGKEGTISSIEMQQFTDFALQLVLPPNPVRNLDHSLTPEQQDGEDLFFSATVYAYNEKQAYYIVDNLIDEKIVWKTLMPLSRRCAATASRTPSTRPRGTV